ncbi:hypothetical protein AVEN_249754-1 [Araneus ventricosus]|uniref:RNase H type-1 domain-containing protein n=1 Tax=Araneus ventricosus TaxID=182803 RepID=A0A4Y2C7S3_ARAVE|nr:hypothetical protein AVEN_249754-1 [Araneus ventricosus]
MVPPLCSNESNRHGYGQLCISDSTEARNRRMENNQACLHSVMEKLDTSLRSINPFAESYLQMHQLMQSNPAVNVKMVFMEHPDFDLYRYNVADMQPQDLEMKARGWSIHPSEHLKPNQISLEDGEANIARKDIINIFTDGSKTEHGIGAAFCVLPMTSRPASGLLNSTTTTPYFKLNSLHFMKQ